jgi:ATP-dependent Clp protease adaptor protein ClpS
MYYIAYSLFSREGGFVARHSSARLCYMSSSRSSTQSNSSTAIKERTTAPRKYRVILLNDDITTMDFVIEILEQVFELSSMAANEIMLRVHREGRGLAGVYEKQVAEAKIAEVAIRARVAKYPLQCIMEIDE